MKGRKRVVIVGQGAAGLSALEAFRRYDKKSEIIVISKERFPYTRVFLHHYLDGSITEDVLYIRDRSFYKDHRVRFIKGKVVSVDPSLSKIFLENEREISYDMLLIATGASPIIPDVPGMVGKDIFTFWSLEDVKGIKRRMGRINSVAIIGGGLVGIQAMQAFVGSGKKVYVIEAAEQILSRIVDGRLSMIIEDYLIQKGIHLRKNERVSEIRRKGKRSIIFLSNGDEIAVDAVVVAVGAKPDLPDFIGGEVKKGSGIIVDERMRSNINNIFAAGDVAQSTDIITGKKEIHALWSIAVEQGKIAGENMAGINSTYEGALSWSTLNIFDLQITSFGQIEDGHYDVRLYEKKDELIYRKLIYREDRLIGGLFLNFHNDAGVLYTLSKKGVRLSLWKELLHKSPINYGKLLNAYMRLLI